MKKQSKGNLRLPPCSAIRFGKLCSDLDCELSGICPRVEMTSPYIPPEAITGKIINECRGLATDIVRQHNMPPMATREYHDSDGDENVRYVVFPEQLMRFYHRWPGRVMHNGTEQFLDIRLLWLDEADIEAENAYNPETAFEGNLDPIGDGPVRLEQWWNSNVTTDCLFPENGYLTKLHRWSVIASLLFSYRKAIQHPAHKGNSFFHSFGEDKKILR